MISRPLLASAVAAVAFFSSVALGYVRQCDGYDDAPLQLLGAEFPYTIVLPSEIVFSLWTRIMEDLPETVTLDVDITMLEPFPQDVPCVDDGNGNVFGSCKYDLCPIIESTDEWCPYFPEGQECACPLGAGDYNLTDVTMTVPDFGEVFGDLMEGSYEAVGLLLDGEEETVELGCIEFTFEFVLA